MATETENIMKSLNKSFSGESSSKPEIEREFGERLKTYIAEQRWVKKPLAVSPTVCSQYGWKCIRSDLLECVTCTAKLSVHQPSMEKYEAYKASLNKFLKDLEDSHKKHCPWPLTPSPENFVKMTAVPKEEALCQFLQRFKPCLLFKDSIPQIKESVLLDLGLTGHHISALCKLAEVHSDEASQLGKSLVTLAATGWTMTSEGQESERVFLTCINCQRHTWSGYFNHVKYDSFETVSEEVGTKTNTSESVNETLQAKNGTGSLDAPPSKRKKFSLLVKTDEPFDPLHEHRPWCLWITFNSSEDKFPLKNPNESKTVDEVESIPGWKIYMKSLLRNISEIQDIDVKESPSKERIRNVRSMLETWADVIT